jgi:hypothetical protein
MKWENGIYNTFNLIFVHTYIYIYINISQNIL